MVFPAVFNVSSLNGKNGFTIVGILGCQLNCYNTVRDAGDINADGIADIIIGAPNANNGIGQSYVVYGNRNGFSAQFSLASLNGQNGFVINGMNPNDQSGSSASYAGDINADGIADIIIGAPNANNYTGQSYIIFGSKYEFPSVINITWLDGKNGFVINGVSPNDQSGSSVSNVGDINDDGIDDVIVGASRALGFAGQSYVVFGNKSGFPAQFNITALNGANGFIINGFGSFAGVSLSRAGDINFDGISDFIIGSDAYSPGQSYVVFGNKLGFPYLLKLSDLNGQNGFMIISDNNDLYGGGVVSHAGDINADSIDDIIITSACVGDCGMGIAYILYGNRNGFSSQFNLTNLNGQNGFIINGINQTEWTGGSVSGAGDLNNDGIDDIIIGTLGQNINYTMQNYVIFGSKYEFPMIINSTWLNGQNGFAINVGYNFDSEDVDWQRLVSDIGDINDDGIDDIIIAAHASRDLAGQAYVIFGQSSTFEDNLDI
jgi:hypothetical protein